MAIPPAIAAVAAIWFTHQLRLERMSMLGN